jgi:hypothetical protein
MYNLVTCSFILHINAEKSDSRLKIGCTRVRESKTSKARMAKYAERAQRSRKGQNGGTPKFNETRVVCSDKVVRLSTKLTLANFKPMTEWNLKTGEYGASVNSSSRVGDGVFRG